ncbi:class I SAM-dependent methyltransferase [Agaribacterium sp. ZY112]|uniref:class I SAM-dependent methyltransferase n=1 Tax=Agaribacterium sp. ZY112 TaxID=3233574 RepID=UPI0035264DD6
MPFSVDYFRSDIKNHIVRKFPSNKTTILDVGAGAGAYAKLLRSNYPSIDACEIWPPYIEQFKLNQLYRKVYVDNIVNTKIIFYDVIIMGDILEHMSVINAQKTIERLSRHCTELIVVVPFESEQEEEFHNPYEEHIQADLNPKIMHQRYGRYLQLADSAGADKCWGYEIALYFKKPNRLITYQSKLNKLHLYIKNCIESTN